MRIAEAASKSGLSVDTIRFYEKSGLLPKIVRGTDGNRRFSAEVVDWLVLLYWLRETGMPMKTMQEFAILYRAGDATMPQRKKILLTHAAHLEERRAALDRCEEILAYKIKIYEDREKENQ